MQRFHVLALVRTLGIGLSTLAVMACDAAPQADICDRACLAAFEQHYLQSVVQRDPALVPIAADVRYTEDARELQPGAGLWGTATALRQHRLSVLDDLWDTAAGFAIIDEGSETVLLSYRLKVENGALAEIETLVSRYDPDGPAMSPTEDFATRGTFATVNEAFHYEIPQSLRNTREEIIDIADHYPAGLKAGSFVAVDAPMAVGAGRLENGTILAGPDCMFNENCRNMKTQPSPERPTLRFRRLAVDDVTGIAFYWLDWVQSGTGNNLVAFEAFKVYDSNIQAVEAFLKFDDRERYPGWD